MYKKHHRLKQHRIYLLPSSFAQVFVPTSVSANCAINKEYADSLLTETSLFSKIDNTTDFISAIDNLAIYPDASPDTSNEVNVSEVLSYMSIYDKSEQSTAPSTTVYTTPLSIQITPASINSKFYINVALLLSNGTTPGASICGLYKNGNALIEKFSIIDRGTDADLIASCTTFIDAPNDVAPVTYDVRIYLKDKKTFLFHLNSY